MMNFRVGSLAILSLVSCKPKIKKIEVSPVAYILGPTNDILPVSKGKPPQLTDEILHASVLIATTLNDGRVKFCSGTLVESERPGENLRIVSNHHCFAQADESSKATPEILPEACRSTFVYFDFQKDQSHPTSVSGCVRGSLRTSFDFDLSVFTLSSNPVEKYLPLKLWNRDINIENRSALVIHYPDIEENMALPPNGTVRLPTAAYTLNDCKIVGFFAANETALDRTLPFGIRHTCDLVHGSSGSALIDLETHTIMGVNWGGIKISENSGVRTDNVATSYQYVAAFLENRITESLLVKSIAGAGGVSRLDGNGNTVDTQKASNQDRKSTSGNKLPACGVLALATANSRQLPENLLIFILINIGAFAPLVTVRIRRSFGK